MLELRPLLDSDIPIIETWLNKAHVKRWYEIPQMNISIDDWMTEIKKRHGTYKWLNHRIMMVQEQPIGLCQYYRCTDSDEDFGSLPIPGSYGIDYLIGEEAFLNKGMGKAMITLLIEEIMRLPDAQRITADIDKDNKASEKTLLSCGFTLWDAEDCRYIKEY